MQRPARARQEPVDPQLEIVVFKARPLCSSFPATQQKTIIFLSHTLPGCSGFKINAVF
jgi:hypothetical protein